MRWRCPTADVPARRIATSGVQLRWERRLVGSDGRLLVECFEWVNRRSGFSPPWVGTRGARSVPVIRSLQFKLLGEYRRPPKYADQEAGLKLGCQSALYEAVLPYQDS